MIRNPKYVSSLPLSFLLFLSLRPSPVCYSMFPTFLPSFLPSSIPPLRSFFLLSFPASSYSYLSVFCIIQKYFGIFHKSQGTAIVA